MTAQEYRDALEHLGLTIAGAAKLLGVNERTSRDWADLRPPDQRTRNPAQRQDGPPEPVARFLRYMIAAGVTPDEVERVLRGG